EIRAATLFELCDRLPALLDHLFDRADDRGIVELDALVDLALLDGGEDQANRGQPCGVLRPHGGLHVLGDLLLERDASKAFAAASGCADACVGASLRRQACACVRRSASRSTRVRATR